MHSGRLSSPRKGRDKGLGWPDKKPGTPTLGLVNGLEVEGSAKEKGWKLRRLRLNTETTAASLQDPQGTSFLLT